MDYKEHYIEYYALAWIILKASTSIYWGKSQRDICFLAKGDESNITERPLRTHLSVQNMTSVICVTQVRILISFQK